MLLQMNVTEQQGTGFEFINCVLEVGNVTVGCIVFQLMPVVV